MGLQRVRHNWSDWACHVTKVNVKLQWYNSGLDPSRIKFWVTPQGFPGGSAGKQSAYNAGDLGLIPGLGRSPGERKGYPLQYSGLENSMDCIVHGVAKSQTWLSNVYFHVSLYLWASLIAQLVKNPPSMLETWVWSLGWEDPLEKGKATHSSIMAWKIPWTVTNKTRLNHFH